MGAEVLYAVYAMASSGGGGAGQGAPAGGFDGTFFFMIIATFAIIYFLIMRPQQKQQKQHQQMLQALQKGDEVVTAGGIYGKIIDIEENTVDLKVAEGTKIKIERSRIGRVVNKGS